MLGLFRLHAWEDLRALSPCATLQFTLLKFRPLYRVEPIELRDLLPEIFAYTLANASSSF